MNVYLACPTYDGTLWWRTARAIWNASRLHRIVGREVGDPVHSESSVITYNCNLHWCNALNGRAAHGYEWFAMLHSDVAPDKWWLDEMIAEAQKHGADLLSAIVPIKKDEGPDAGATSTAILHSGDPGSFPKKLQRLTLAQALHPSFPDTFGINEAAEALERLPAELRETNVPREALLVNTGCMIVRCDKPWAERVFFHDWSGIAKVDDDWLPVLKSEDWSFSHRVAQEGGKVMATRLLKVVHRGTKDYPSDRANGNARDQRQESGEHVDSLATSRRLP